MAGAPYDCENGYLSTTRHDRWWTIGGARAQQSNLFVLVQLSNLGGGLAYSTDDSDHRLNAPIEAHLVDPADHAAF